MQKLGHHRFSFAGHSMGGGIGMTLVLKRPDKLKKLVLMASIGSKGLIGDSFRQTLDRISDVNASIGLR